MKLGEMQTLVVDHVKEFGAFLRDETEEGQGQSAGLQEETDRRGRMSGTVLLPRKSVPAGLKPGDRVMVFLYRDSSDRLIATTAKPALTLHETGLLKVKEVSKVGAFLDWGLEKDLLLPFHEQTRKVKKDEEVLAAVYIDKSSRLCATMNVYPYLRTDSPYGRDDKVSGRIYETSDHFGVFVAVDDRYSGLIPRAEVPEGLRIGDVVQARVTRVLKDGKLNLAVRQKAYRQMDQDAEKVLGIIYEYEGVLPFDDRVSPEIIERETGLSKNAFKRAVGHLMKKGLVEIRDRRIYAKDRGKQDS